MSELLNLAARVEGLAGADREVDRDIHALVDGWEKRWNDEFEFFQLWKGDGWIGLGSVPAYTASLDAAMSLKPEGWRITGLWERNCELPNWIWKAELWHPDADKNISAIARNADVPALTLTAAALKARAAIEGEG